MSSEEIKKFFDQIAPYKYHSLDIRVVAFKFQDKWVNLGTRILLEVSPGSSLKIIEDLPRFDNLIAIHEVRPASELQDILESLSNGKLRVSGEEISYVRQIESGEPKLGCYLSFRAYPRDRSHRIYDKDFKFVYLYDWGVTLNNLVKDFEELDWSLRSFKYPYDGIADLATSFLCLTRPLDSHYTAYLDVIAPTYVRFGENCEIEKGVLQLEIESYLDIDTLSLNLGIIERFHDSSLRRYTVECVVTKEKSNGRKFKFKHKVGDCFLLDIFLSYGEDVVDTIKIYNPSQILSRPFVKMHNHFDPKLEVLQKYLIGQGDKPSKNFESSVSLLLSLCGFLCYPYGLIPELRNSVDGIALVPNTDKGFVYECTIDLPDKGNKLSKLSQRTKELRNVLSDFKLSSILFTALMYDNIPESETKKAAMEGISVVSSENIQEALNLFLEGKAPKDIFEYVKGLVPSQNRYSAP